MMQADDAPPSQQPPNNTNPLLPYPLFDLVLDLPHAAASRPASTTLTYPPSNNDTANIISQPLPSQLLEIETAKIARFAFPSYEDRSNAAEVSNRLAFLQRTGGPAVDPPYNRHDLYLDQVYNISSDSSAILPSHHVFSHRLSNGCIVHGHVRHYLPTVEETQRSNVGRRSVRALVILTRYSGGGDRLYRSILKTCEVLIRKERSLSEKGEEETKLFLHELFQQHVNLCRDVSSNQGGLSKPRIVTMSLIEAGRGHGLFGTVDSIKFAIPPSFLHEREPEDVSSYSRNDMMPMLRSLGVTRTLRLLSALISEKRVILTSETVAKLSAVGYGAVSMMGQGMLPPPSVFVPVLPPGLASLLSTPSAYLIGVLKGSTPNFIDLRSMVPSLGELVIFDLDSIGNEPFFVGMTNPTVTVPDLTRRSFEDVGDASLNGMSLPDMLYQDLSEVVKLDKRQMFWQGAVQEKLGMAAEKGKTAARNAINKGLKYLKDKKRSMDGKEEDEEEEEAAEKPDNANSLTKLVGKGNYFYEQGFPNESAEVEARIAFATFFVCLLGDLRVFLTQTAPGTTPVADRDKFMKFRANSGDFPGSSMYNLLQNFLRSNLFNQFVDARLKELQLRRPVPEDAPLFSLAANYHRSNKIDFVANNIRQSVRQVATNPNLPGKYLTSWNEGIRRRVLDLTSTQAFNGDARRALALLTEDCHESTSILIDTIMILWTRMQEGKGMQWKKALLALQIFRDLLLNGPISAVAEAIDGFASIRIMKSYVDAMRGQNSALVRAAASEVYNLTVNLPVLFAMRREALNKQRMIKDPKPSPLRKETRMIKGISQFRNVHIALRPAGAAVAPAPPAPTPLGNDLLGNEAPFNNAPQPANYSSDLLSMGLDTTPQKPQQMPNPFDMAAMSQSILAVNASGNAAPTNQAIQEQAQPPTPVSVANATSAINPSQPQPNQTTPRASPPTIAQNTQQPMVQQQPFPTQQGLQQPVPPASPIQHVQQQQARHQQGMMQNSMASTQIPPQQQQQHQTMMQQPYMQPPAQQQYAQQQQWGSVQQPMPQGFNNGMPPQLGFHSAMQPQQHLQHGFQQLHQQQQQQQQPPPQNKPNFSMFDPLAK